MRIEWHKEERRDILLTGHRLMHKCERTQSQTAETN